MSISIEHLEASDYPAIRKIFQEGIDSGLATFETHAPDWQEWDKRFWNKCRIVARSNGQIVGWGSLSDVSRREVYKGVKEDTVYVSRDHHGKGIGGLILSELVKRSEALGVWTLQAVMFPENIASVSLHSSLGFREVGVRKDIGKLDGRWRDTLLMERRSSLGL